MRFIAVSGGIAGHTLLGDDMLDSEFLAILACPKCKGELEYTGDKLICHQCALAYPVRDDIPIMLIAEAEAIPASQEDEQ